MPDNTNDIPVILAVADSLAPSGVISDSQRAAALEAIALFRALSPQFLENAEKVLTDGNAPPAEVFNATVQGSRTSTALHIVLKALWVLEEASHNQSNARIAMMGKEGSRQ